MVSRLRHYRVHALLFAIGLIVYSAFAGNRLTRQSDDPQYVYQAAEWLQGNLDISPPPRRGDDWAALIRASVRRDDATEEVRGRWLVKKSFAIGDAWLRDLIETPRLQPNGQLRLQRFFRTTEGHEIPESLVEQEHGQRIFNSFPPVPTLLMLPSAILHGRGGGDVFPTVLIAALVLPLCFATLRQLHRRGTSQRSVSDDIWLVACMAFGTLFFYASVQGRVWYTAHVCGVAMVFVYLWAAIGARHPVVAGLALALAALSRPATGFLFPFFVWETMAKFGRQKSGWLHLVKFAVPMVALGAAAMIYNQVRFDSPFEFGHFFLRNARQLPLIDQYGLFDYRYLSRNLSVALTLLPQFSDVWPYLRVSQHGMALWITTPLFLFLLWPARRTELFWPLVVSITCAAIPILLYQNSGRVQFGYRFSLDYTPLLLLLFASCGRSLSRPVKAIIALGIAINTAGALLFHRSYVFFDFF